MRAVFGTPRPVLYLLGVGAFIGFVALVFRQFDLSTGGSGEGFAFTRIGSAVALTHYDFDSFLWFDAARAAADRLLTLEPANADALRLRQELEGR